MRLRAIRFKSSADPHGDDRCQRQPVVLMVELLGEKRHGGHRRDAPDRPEVIAAPTALRRIQNPTRARPAPRGVNARTKRVEPTNRRVSGLKIAGLPSNPSQIARLSPAAREPAGFKEMIRPKIPQQCRQQSRASRDHFQAATIPHDDQQERESTGTPR